MTTARTGDFQLGSVQLGGRYFTTLSSTVTKINATSTLQAKFSGTLSVGISATSKLTASFVGKATFAATSVNAAGAIAFPYIKGPILFGVSQLGDNTQLGGMSPNIDRALQGLIPPFTVQIHATSGVLPGPFSVPPDPHFLGVGRLGGGQQFLGYPFFNTLPNFSITTVSVVTPLVYGPRARQLGIFQIGIWQLPQQDSFLPLTVVAKSQVHEVLAAKGVLPVTTSTGRTRVQLAITAPGPFDVHNPIAAFSKVLVALHATAALRSTRIDSTSTMQIPLVQYFIAVGPVSINAEGDIAVVVVRFWHVGRQSAGLVPQPALVSTAQSLGLVPQPALA